MAEGRNKKRKLDTDLFNVDEENKVATCKICGKQVKSLRNFTYMRHYSTQHKEIAKENGFLTEGDDAANLEAAEADGVTDNMKISVKLNNKVYTKSLVELVTVNGVPLKVLDCSALRRILDPVEKGLKEKYGQGTERVTSRSIKPILGNVSEKLKNRIMAEVNGKMICLKLDIATRLGRDVLCINVQFIEKNKIKIRTLSMVELKDRHTAEHLEKVLLETLSAYKINVSQIFSCTTDNGSNMLATNKRFAARQQESEVFSLIMEENNQDQINEMADASDDDSDDDAENLDGNEENESDDFDESEHELSVMNKVTPIFCGVRCAAHTAQLAVSDTIKEAKLKKCLNSIQAFVKKLRKMPYKNLFKLNNKEIPQLSCETRWNSWYDMAVSVKSQKEFICSITKNDKECSLSNETWTFIDNFVEGFEPMAQLTVALQSSQLTFGDFYLLWLRCKLLLEKKNSPLSKQLLTKMKNRESALTENKAFLAAIYLDQRINYRNSPLISEEQRQCALEHLKQTWRSIERAAHGGSTNVSIEDPMEGPSSNDDILEDFFRSHEVSNDSSISTSLFDELEDLSRLPRLKLEKDQTILDFWYSQTQAKPDMYSLVAVVLSTPATQVSTERAFSTLAFILTKLRTRLSEATLSNILLIRLNAELFQQLKI